MKNKMKLGMCSALLLSGLACGTLGTNDLVAHASSNTINMNVAQQEGSQFTDVKADHWAYESIHWAQSKGIISGYGDGRFGPNDAVTEAQFVKMISNFLGLKDDYGNIVKTTKSAHWSDSSYDAIAKYGVPLNGYFDNTIRNKPMKRGLVAQVITHLVGYKTDLEGSIEFLLDNKITAGQNPQFKDKDLYQFFGTTNTLSRSQVVAFLHRLETEKLNSLSETIEKPNGKSLNDIATAGKKRVDNSISQGKTPSNNNGGISVTPNNPVQTPGDSGGSLEGVQLGVDSKYAKNLDAKVIKDFEKKISDTVGTLASKKYIYSAANESKIWISNTHAGGVGFIKIENAKVYNVAQGSSVEEEKVFVSLAADYYDVSISYKEFENAAKKATKLGSTTEIKNGVYFGRTDVGVIYLFKK